MHVKASQLKGSNRCYQRRERDISFETNKDDRFQRAVIIKSLIKNYFISKALDGRDDDVRRVYTTYIAKNMKFEDVPEKDQEVFRLVRTVLSSYDDLVYSYEEDDVSEMVSQSKEFGYIKNRLIDMFISRMNFMTDVTAEEQAEYNYQLIVRYLHYETRTPEFPVTKEMDIFGVTVDVKPDFIFHNADGSIEAVKLCCKNPDVTVSGKKKDKSLYNNMELYALWRYARDLIPNDTDIRNIEASFYFLKRKGDVRDRLVTAFSEPGANNIVTMSELVTKKNTAKLDKLFFDQFVEYIAGEACTGETCKTCDFCDLCNFAKVPVSSKTEKEKRKVSDIDLSKAQEEAVYFRKGICRINAGAGVGKTLVVALRTALMLSEGIPAEDMLLVTFTDAAATEMRERIAMYDEDLGTDTDMSKLRCMTFNSFGDGIIKDNYKVLGFDREPKVIDDIERKDIITDILNEYEVPGIDYRNFDMVNINYYGALAVASKAFEIIKRDRLSSYDDKALEERMNKAGYGSSIQDTRAYTKLLALYDIFDEKLKEECLIEFLDQERLVFDLLDIDPYYFDKLNLKHITIDEFQDSSDNQIALVKHMLATKNFESLVVVGDDSQSIYGFRDAVPENLIDFFDKIEEEGKDIYIVENHRSTPQILDFANEVNKRNRVRVDKDLVATRPDGKEPVIEGFFSIKDEYNYIADTVQKKLDEGVCPDDIAILAQSSKELISIQSVLSDRGIDTILKCPESMLDNSKVQGLIALCRMIKDKNDTQDIAIYENTVRDGSLLDLTDEEIIKVIEKRQNLIKEFHHKEFNEKLDTFNKMADEIVADDEIAKNLRDRLDHFPTLGEKFDYIEKFVKFNGEKLKRDGKYSGVVLTTAHSSKGLEYNIVINSISKYDKMNRSFKAIEENRRLLFVSSTRARDELYITGQYKVGGNSKEGYVYNRYLEEAYAIMGKPWDPVDPKDKAKEAKAYERAKATVLKGQTSLF